MNKDTGCESFLEEWEAYLKQQNHETVPKGDSGQYWHLLRSRDEQGSHFLWIIMCHPGNVKRFSESELRILDSINKTINKPEIRIFVVVKFCLPDPKVIVAGINFVLKKKAISSSKGGLDWSSWNQSS